MGAALRPSSPPVASPQSRRRLRLALLGTCGMIMSVPAAHAAQPGATLQAQERRIVIDGRAISPDGSTKLNTTGRTVTLTVPAKDGPRYLGDIILTVSPDDQVEFSAERLLDLLANVLDADVQRALRGSFSGKTTLSPADFEASGIHIRYNPADVGARARHRQRKARLADRSGQPARSGADRQFRPAGELQRLCQRPRLARLSLSGDE
jgi:hypothetical protein